MHWFCVLQISGSNPVGDGQAISFSEKQHLKIDDFITLLMNTARIKIYKCVKNLYLMHLQYIIYFLIYLLKKCLVQVSHLEIQLLSSHEKLEDVQDSVGSEIDSALRQSQVNIDKELDCYQQKICSLSSENSEYQTEVSYRIIYI